MGSSMVTWPGISKYTMRFFLMAREDKFLDKKVVVLQFDEIKVRKVHECHKKKVCIISLHSQMQILVEIFH